MHRNLAATPEAFLGAVAPFRDDLVVAVECLFTWYWLADLCADEGIAFVLGHALYMKEALSILAARLGRTVYVMLQRREPFDPAKFFAHS